MFFDIDTTIKDLEKYISEPTKLSDRIERLVESCAKVEGFRTLVFQEFIDDRHTYKNIQKEGFNLIPYECSEYDKYDVSSNMKRFISTYTDKHKFTIDKCHVAVTRILEESKKDDIPYYLRYFNGDRIFTNEKLNSLLVSASGLGKQNSQ
jgi:hypothetical protein